MPDGGQCEINRAVVSSGLQLAWFGVTRETGKLAEVPGCAVGWRVTARCCGVARQSGVMLMLLGLKDGVVVVSVVCG